MEERMDSEEGETESTIILKIFPINRYRKTEHQVKGDVSQGKILKYLPVDGND